MSNVTQQNKIIEYLENFKHILYIYCSLISLTKSLKFKDISEKYQVQNLEPKSEKLLINYPSHNWNIFKIEFHSLISKNIFELYN